MPPLFERFRRWSPGKKPLELGFYSKPRLETQGEYAGKIVKEYRGLVPIREVSETMDAHLEYVEKLRGAGVNVPETKMTFKREGEGFRLLIVQKAFPTALVLSNVFAKAGEDECVGLLKAAMSEANKLVSLNARLPQGDAVGFHPSLRNFMVQGGRLHYIDTFPPLVRKKGAGLEEKIIAAHAFEHAPALAQRLSRPFTRLTTQEYYMPGKMIGGIVHSAIRRRPELKEKLLATAREFAKKQLHPGARQAVLGKLDKIAKLRKP
ncbi:MAG: DUF6206 family protein [Candidatus Micrarchaeota archaeon]|nr:DUF6206 family protein [Candidatus Micrarchaeota archaeon]